MEEFDLYVRYSDINDVPGIEDDDDGISVPTNQFGLTVDDYIEVSNRFDPLSNDVDSGIQHFFNVCNYIITNFNKI